MTPIPSGTVTFLFTDIEGSTRLAQADPELWERLKDRHHEILRSAIESNNGHVFQIIGDAFCAAFDSPQAGVSCAITAQRKLMEEDWGETPIKVRMGLHSGFSEWQENSYRGYLTLAIVQRIMSVAFGGQILISNTTAELVRGDLKNGIKLRDLQEHRLKGITELERLWQVVAPGLRQEFPPLQSLKEIPNNLPSQLSSFIGREKELEQIRYRLGDHRLVTLTGSGGVGKTRLSIQAASEILSGYPNGAWVVELAPVSDPALITRSICSALGVIPQGNTSALDVLTDYLKQKKILLVLDNCEHLIEACARLCDSLLHACPDLHILTSSREALGIDGEGIYHVPSLSLPNPKDTLQTIQNAEAVKLFIERARGGLPGFQITEANAPVIAQICQRLDGIPLAIELAASRVKLLKVEQIAVLLDNVFRLLTGGSRTALPRHQTLHALIDWSYNLLSDEERRVLQCFSVFSGGWTLEGAQAVCNDPFVLDLLAHLVDKSLAVVDLEHGDEPHYYLLETIRQYAHEKLAETGETSLIRDRHLAYFFALAKHAETEVQGAEQLVWFDRLEIELENFRAAFAWSLESGENGAEIGLHMASSLWLFWYLRNHSEEGRWLEKLLHANRDSADLVTRANALSRLSFVHFFSTSAAEEALVLGQTLGPPGRESMALALMGKGAWAVYQADLDRGILLLETSVKLFRETGNRWGLCEALSWLGLSLINLGDPQLATPYLEESIALARQAQDGNEIGFALWQLGRAAMSRGDYSKATNLIKEGLAIFKQLKLSSGVAFVLSDLGKVAMKQGDYQQASSCYEEVLTIYWDWGNVREIASGLEQLANAVMHQQGKKAVRLLGAAEALRQSSNKPLFPFQIADYERTRKFLQDQLDEGSFESLWAEGRAMDAKQAVQYALESST